MLSKLAIQNFALIDKIEIDFDTGLTVITGETGAGKSILLGALMLILGNRADHSSLKDKTKKCIVEGTFNISSYGLQSLFQEYDLDFFEETIIRREISAQGKSRNFINDTPTTLEVMKQISKCLIDIHSQHQSLQINDPQFQLEVIDSVAKTAGLLVSYKMQFDEFQELNKKIESLKVEAIESKKQEDYLSFQFQELEELSLKAGEAKKLEEEQEVFSNSEEIVQNLGKIATALNNGEGNAIDSLKQIKQLLSKTAGLHKKMLNLNERFVSALLEVEDIGNEIEQQLDNFQYEPERHQIIEERLGEIYRLQQKHQLPKADHLIDLMNKIERQLTAISNIDSEIAQLEKEAENKNLQLIADAQKISELRLSVIDEIESNVMGTLKQLGIPQVNFKLAHSLKDKINKDGLDVFQFQFSANKGVEPQTISKTASGGEISRLMLSIKSLLVEHKQLPTILFDEIDTGVSGEVAEKMGLILCRIGAKRQVIAITHLPQLAAKGNSHYFVYKQDNGVVSKTQLKKLSAEGRVEELAKMLSGKNLTEAAFNNARELLAQ